MIITDLEIYEMAFIREENMINPNARILSTESTVDAWNNPISFMASDTIQPIDLKYKLPSPSDCENVQYTPEPEWKCAPFYGNRHSSAPTAYHAVWMVGSPVNFVLADDEIKDFMFIDENYTSGGPSTSTDYQKDMEYLTDAFRDGPLFLSGNWKCVGKESLDTLHGLYCSCGERISDVQGPEDVKEDNACYTYKGQRCNV